MMPEAAFKPNTETTSFNSKVKVIGISGCSCSGKTTLASVIQLLLPNCIVIHQDDFYKVDSLIPKDPDTCYDNWDTPEAIDMDKFYEAIVNAVSSGVIVKSSCSQDEAIREASNWVRDSLASEISLKVFDPSKRYIIAEGFLFFHDPKFLALLDGAILAWADYPTLLERREARPGYETKEGFWADPPQYFEKVVWPSFRTFYRSLTSESINNAGPDMVDFTSLSPCPADKISHPGLNWKTKYAVIRTDSSKPLGHSSLEVVSHLASIC